MKKIITKIIRLFVLGGMLAGMNTVEAQYQYVGVYPSLPFDIQKAAEYGNNKCSIWKGVYQKVGEDESGNQWSTTIQESYQYQRYAFPDGKMEMISTYIPIGDKQWTMEFFYKQNLVSAIERLVYDSLQESKIDFTYAYFYQHDGTPFQRVKMYGYPNKSVRLLEEFQLDSLNRVIRKKATAVGFSPYMDSLVGLKDKEKCLTVMEYKDSIETYQVYKNLHLLMEDRKTYLDEDKNAVITKVRNSSGVVLFTIDYKYSQGQMIQKLHWVMKDPNPKDLSKEPEAIPSKKKKQKPRKRKKKQLVEQPQPVKRLPIPEIYKVEYFTYTEEGLLERHIIEEDGLQTIFEYSYFSE